MNPLSPHALGLGYSLAVDYQTSIVERQPGGKLRTVKQNPPRRNLLLDSGLDLVVTRSFSYLIDYVAVGDGATPTKRDSGVIRVSIAGETATADGSFFEPADVGRLLKLDSGQEAYITAYTSATEVAVAGAADDPASEATVWYVNERGLTNERDRFNTKSTDSGDNTKSWNGSYMEYKNTRIGDPVTETVTYREIGWSYDDDRGNNLLGRDVLPGGGDTLTEGQQYKVVVRLRITPAPLTPLAVPNNAQGAWDNSGHEMVTSIRYALMWPGIITGALEPSRGAYLWVLKSDFTLPAGTLDKDSSFYIDSGVSTDTVSEPYVAGSFELVKRGLFGPPSGNGTIYGVALASTSNGIHTNAFVRKYDTPQIKDSNHRLEVAFRTTWGRTLVN